MKICLSIEGQNVRIVEALRRPQGIFIQKALTLPADGLDSYLATTKHKNFILSVDFRELFQEFLNLPPVKGPDLEKLLQNELRRLYPDFSWIYSDLGEKIVENRRIRALSIMRTRREEVEGLIKRFLLHGKNIEAILAAPTCIASFIETQKPVLCLFETDEKNIFLLRDGAILFTRKLASFQKGLSPVDIQGIEMSVTHCIQNLRIPPEEIILGGVFKDIPEQIGGLRVNPLRIPEELHYKGLDISEYLIPSGALYLTFKKGLSGNNFLTDEYKRFRFLKGLLKYSFLSSVFFYIVCLMLVINNLLDIRALTGELDGLYTKYRVFTTFIRSYSNTVTEAKSLQPFLDFLKKEHALPASQVLKELSSYSFDNIEIKAIDLITQGENTNLRISGRVSASSHKGMLLSFNRFINSIKMVVPRANQEITSSTDEALKVEIVNKRFSISDGTFDIDLRFSR